MIRNKMKHIKKFSKMNESDNSSYTISVEEIETKIPEFSDNHMLDGNDEVSLSDLVKKGEFGNGKGEVFYLFMNGNELGYVIFLDGKLNNIIEVYEPRGCRFLEGIFICYGSESWYLGFPSGNSEELPMEM